MQEQAGNKLRKWRCKSIDPQWCKMEMGPKEHDSVKLEDEDYHPPPLVPQSYVNRTFWNLPFCNSRYTASRIASGGISLGWMSEAALLNEKRVGGENVLNRHPAQRKCPRQDCYQQKQVTTQKQRQGWAYKFSALHYFFTPISSTSYCMLTLVSICNSGASFLVTGEAKKARATALQVQNAKLTRIGC